MRAIIAAVGVVIKVVLHFWPRKEHDSRSVDVGDIHGDGTVIGDKASVTIDKRQGIDAKDVLSEVIKEAERKGQADEQINQLRGELAKAIERVRQLETQGNRPDVTEALDEVRKTGDTSRLLELLIKERDKYRDGLIQRNNEIAAVAFLRGDIDVALAATDEVLRLQPNDLISLNQRGHICQLRGNLDEAEKAYLRVQELALAANDAKWQAIAMGNLGMIYQTKGQLDEAEEMHNKALEIGERIGLQEVIARQHDNLGALYQKRGDKKKAREYWEKALAIFKKIGMESDVKKVLGWIEKANQNCGIPP